MKGEHYHYYVCYRFFLSGESSTSTGHFISNEKIDSSDAIKALSKKIKGEVYLRLAPEILSYQLLECDCQPESEDPHVSEVLHALEEREKCKETKRMMGHE